jgi:hypothetical protein
LARLLALKVMLTPPPLVPAITDIIRGWNTPAVADNERPAHRLDDDDG